MNDLKKPDVESTLQRLLRQYSTLTLIVSLAMLAGSVAFVVLGAVSKSDDALSKADKAQIKADQTAAVTKGIIEARTEGRRENCKQLAKVYKARRDEIADDELQIDSQLTRAFFPDITPELRAAIHKRNVRKLRKWDNNRLPPYCVQRHRRERFPAGFKL